MAWELRLVIRLLPVAPIALRGSGLGFQFPRYLLYVCHHLLFLVGIVVGILNPKS